MGAGLLGWLMALALACGAPIGTPVSSASPRGAPHGRSLRGVGQGVNKIAAQKSALSGLSEVIIAKISSTTTIRQRQDNKGSEDSVEVDLRVTSLTLLKGVTYSDPRPVAGGVEVEAILSGAAALETINFLLREVSQDADTLDEAALRGLVERVGLLEALLATSLAARLPEHKRHMAASAAARKLLNQYLNQGLLVFEGDLADAKLTMDGVALLAAPHHFVAPGEHAFEVVKPGHRAVTGRFRISAGERKAVRLPLVRDDGRVHRAYLKCAAADRGICQAFATRLASFSVLPADGTRASNAIRLEIDDVFTEAGGYRKHSLMVTVKVWRGAQVAATLSGKASFNTTPPTEASILRNRAVAVVNKLVPALVNRMVTKNLFGGPDVDYANTAAAATGP